jgi:NAD(P)-dependent dehydrogenase (short-subunit alcohol dehydrogenase family)
MTILITGANRGIGAGLAAAYRARGQMPILVMKFGGTSVATLDRIRRAAKRVGARWPTAMT